MYRSRPASSSGVYGFTDAMVGMFDLIRNVGMISNSDATAIATSTHTLNSNQRPSHMRCHPIAVMRASTPSGAGDSSLLTFVSRPSGAAWITGSAYAAGRRRHVIRMFQPNSSMPTMYSPPPAARIHYIGSSLTTVSMKSGYASRPVSSNARHINPCVTPAL